MKFARQTCVGLLGLASLTLVAGMAFAQPGTQPAKPADPTKAEPAKADPAKQPEGAPNVRTLPSPGKPQPADPLSPAEGGRLEFERIVQDWGLVSDQDLLKAEIKFKNTGTQNLLISETKPSCGCVRPTLKNGKKAYAPGEEGVLEIGFEPMNKQGETKYSITVRSNDPNHPTQNIDVKCDVKPKVGLESPDGLSFGTLDSGTTKSVTFYLFGRDPNFRATFATISAESGFDVKVGETVEAEHRGDKVHKTPVTVTINDKARAAKFSHTVTVRHTDKSVRNGLWDVTITGEVLHDVRSDKKEIDFGVRAVDEQFESEFELTNIKGSAFTVTSLRYRPHKGGNFDFEPVFQPVEGKPGLVKVQIKGKAPARPGVYEGMFQMATDIKGMPAVNIPVKISVRPGA